MPDCSTDAELLRLGFDGARFGLEEALSVRHVDVYFAAHEHSYERTLPVSNGIIDRQADTGRYVDPQYTTHIVSGSAGCREQLDYYDTVMYGPWSVVRSSTYGFGLLTVHNATHLHWEQIIDESRGGNDHMWIVKVST
jgi:hypothetical protein